MRDKATVVDAALIADVLAGLARAYVTEDEYPGTSGQLMRLMADEYRHGIERVLRHSATDEECRDRLLGTAAALRALAESELRASVTA